MSDVREVSEWHEAVEACPCSKVTVQRFTEAHADTLIGSRNPDCTIHRAAETFTSHRAV